MLNTTYNIFIGIIASIISVYFMNGNKIYTKHTKMISFDYRYSSKHDIILYIIGSNAIILMIASILAYIVQSCLTMISYTGTEVALSLLLYIIAPTVTHVMTAALYKVREKRVYGMYIEKFKTKNGMFILALFCNLIYSVCAYRFVWGDAFISAYIQINGNDRSGYSNKYKSFINETNTFRIICIIIVLCEIFSLLIIKIMHNVQKVTLEQYKSFEIGIDKGVIYKLRKDDVIKVSKDKDLLIINNKAGKFKVKVIDNKGSCKTEKINAYYPIYIQHEHIEYIKDYTGNKINYQ